MKGARYKTGGWYGEPHRHYLAAKGIKTTYNADKYSRLGMNTYAAKINDGERRLWVLNNQELYNSWQQSGQSTTDFIKQNRKMIDDVISAEVGYYATQTDLSLEELENYRADPSTTFDRDVEFVKAHMQGMREGVDDGSIYDDDFEFESTVSKDAKRAREKVKNIAGEAARATAKGLKQAGRSTAKFGKEAAQMGKEKVEQFSESRTAEALRQQRLARDRQVEAEAAAERLQDERRARLKEVLTNP